MSCSNAIIVVEDEPDLRETIREFLEMEGFRVRTAANGREALELLGADLCSCLVLLDLMMPEMNGWEFLETVRKEHAGFLSSTPVVVVSAAAGLGKVRETYGCEVMQKPVSLFSIAALAEAHCQRQ